LASSTNSVEGGEDSSASGAKKPRVAKAAEGGGEDAAESGAKSKTKAPESGGEDSEGLVVAKAVRQYLKNNETPLHCGGDALPALSGKVAGLLRDAARRAQQNGRKTLKGCDF
jgi:histone H3/H4